MFLCNIHPVVHFGKVTDWFKAIISLEIKVGVLMGTFPNFANTISL